MAPLFRPPHLSFQLSFLRNSPSLSPSLTICLNVKPKFSLFLSDPSIPNRMQKQLGKALEKLLIVVQETIENGAAELFYKKAVECLVLARSVRFQFNSLIP